MAKPKQCDHCGKPATIHLTQIVGGEIRKVDLCEACQFKDSMAADFDLKPFAKLADGVLAAHNNTGEVHACPVCGCDDNSFQKSGRFGCPDCYEAFAGIVPEVLRNIQPGLRHEGKSPEVGLVRRHFGRKKVELRKELESAIREERFEAAAVYRDQLRKLEGREANAIEN